jgi:hypothetical protein
MDLPFINVEFSAQSKPYSRRIRGVVGDARGRLYTGFINNGYLAFERITT